MPLSASICAIKDLIRQSLRKFKAFKKKNLWENLSEGGVEYKIRVEPLLIFSFWHFWLFFSWIGTNPESVRILNRYDFFSVPIQDSYRFRIRTDSGSVPIQETPNLSGFRIESISSSLLSKDFLKTPPTVLPKIGKTRTKILANLYEFFRNFFCQMLPLTLLCDGFYKRTLLC